MHLLYVLKIISKIYVLIISLFDQVVSFFNTNEEKKRIESKIPKELMDAINGFLPFYLYHCKYL